RSSSRSIRTANDSPAGTFRLGTVTEPWPPGVTSCASTRSVRPRIVFGPLLRSSSCECISSSIDTPRMPAVDSPRLKSIKPTGESRGNATCSHGDAPWSCAKPAAANVSRNIGSQSARFEPPGSITKRPDRGVDERRNEELLPIDIRNGDLARFIVDVTGAHRRRARERNRGRGRVQQGKRGALRPDRDAIRSGLNHGAAGSGRGVKSRDPPERILQVAPLRSRDVHDPAGRQDHRKQPRGQRHAPACRTASAHLLYAACRIQPNLDVADHFALERAPVCDRLRTGKGFFRRFLAQGSGCRFKLFHLLAALPETLKVFTHPPSLSP